MEAKGQDRWRVLCEQATREQNPQKLLQLVQEINTLLADAEDEKKRPHPDGMSHGKSA